MYYIMRKSYYVMHKLLRYAKNVLRYAVIITLCGNYYVMWRHTCSRNFAALFGSLSSTILSTCPAHCNLLLASLSVKLHCTPVSFLNSTILRLSALVTLAIFRTQLFSHTCSLCCCSSVRAKVSVPYRHAGVTQVLLMTLPFSLFEIRRSAITPSTALHAFATGCTLRRTSLSVFPIQT